MALILNIIVIIFEVLFYSLFMKFARKEGKFWKYLLLFTLFSFVSLFLNKQFVINYILIFLLILYGLKYIVKLKISLYDLLFIIVMFLIKFLIEAPISIIIYNILYNLYLAAIITSIFKILILIVINKIFKINKLYIKLNNRWVSNNFYIRYIFSILIFIYVIISAIFLIVKWI